MKPRSYALPIILIGLGAIFLINNVVPELSVWRLLADWWPLLLILFGVLRLTEVLFAYRAGTLQTQSFRPMGFGWILIIVFLGVALSIPHHERNWRWGPIRTGSVDLFGEEFDYPVSVASAPVRSAKRLVLDNVRGNITVTGSDTDAVRIEGHKIVRAYNRDAADRVNSQTAVTISPEGEAIFIRTNEPSTPQESRLSVDLDIALPRAMSLEARGRQGDLTVNSVEGAVDVSSQRGEVRLQDVASNAKLNVEHCDLVRISNLKGALDLQGSGRDIQLEKIDGQATINGRFSGTLDFRSLAKPLHFESEQTDMRIEKLPGNVTMDLGDLRASDLTGPIRLVTHSRDVHLEDFSGPVDIELGRGDVDLKPARGSTLGRMDIRSRHGNIELALPAGAPFDLKATTQQGQVTNDYGDTIIAENNEGHTSTMRSASPSGPVIALNTDRGEVSVRKLE